MFFPCDGAAPRTAGADPVFPSLLERICNLETIVTFVAASPPSCDNTDGDEQKQEMWANYNAVSAQPHGGSSFDGIPCTELFHSAANVPADVIRDWSASQTWEVFESELYDIIPNVVRRTPQSTQAPSEAKPCVSPESFKTTPETAFRVHAPEFTPATVEEYG